ncbi:HD-GYP domain-containing protein [Cohnella pontilimi]|uniref:HD-GYP domain-containing protein n=1 Tax=Cohnella pontilimi TaxID=2564100 RepID=A0A4U0F9S0_9BACL|nr:HD-GYP domain-containing protein [Cohnella pontilimi]TJY41506.1 HD-GYP domain-containing protein [Cohnella pontilimi]
MRVHITDLQAGDCLLHDVFNEHGMHVLSKGTVLSDKELTHLALHRVEYADILSRPGLQAHPNPPTILNSQLTSHFQDAVSGFIDVFEKALLEGRVYEDDMQGSFQPLVDSFKTAHDVVSMLLLLNSQDDYTYQHSVQVGMLSYYIAKWMGWDEKQTWLAGQAGFLHDIGKCRIPDEILNKPGKLSDEEYKEIQKHTLYGYEILKNSSMDEALALAAYHHHERMDGQGYPQALKADQIHPLAKIVSVADIYSAMISTRVYQEKRDLLNVLRELHRLSFHELDPEVTQTFISHMVPNFIGKQAALSDGRIGTIVFINPSDVLSPLVQCGDSFIDLSRERKHEIVRIFM